MFEPIRGTDTIWENGRQITVTTRFMSDQLFLDMFSFEEDRFTSEWYERHVA